MTATDMPPAADLAILRDLLPQYAEAGAQSAERKTADLWRRLNRLEPVRPLVWIDEIPWEELEQHGGQAELALRCTDPYCRSVEQRLRRTLYQWRHMRGDMVIEPVLYADVACGPTNCYADYGIRADETHGASNAFHGQISSLDDVARLREPEVWVDWEETARRVAILQTVADGLLPVERQGIAHQWATPWDVMVHWYGIEQLYIDMLDNPDLVHALLARYMEIQHAILDRQTELGILDQGGVNIRVGSGGLGITDELPPVPAGQSARPANQWGCGNAQIFSEVSPQMHWEFSLQYEKPYLERFGLSYYGCCEPLHRKLEILRRIDNLRKISMSCWVDIPSAADAVGADYVFSFKPNPALLAGEAWDPDHVRRYLANAIEAMRGCRVEIILKDITTVRNQPQRLWEWTSIAEELVADG